PMQFAFLGKGTGGKLLAAKKLAPKVIAETKKAEGGTLFKGRLFGDDGQLVFEVAKEPPATLAKQLKTTITRDAALMMQVEIRGGAYQEEEEEDPPPAPPPPVSAPTSDAAAVPATPSSEGAARFTARLKALLPAIQKELASATATGQEIRLRVSDANVFAR